ncbi:hypothetical protein Micbo1qcDRAFT_12295 [Microdochium bolleyi]|uniref:Uncharacterized protein n=1 Tax=Microdochium bolleyi TaxID=196109 RepID=A0A136IXA3_9PEZI|nr:hypothetical protein Micbo1qcDRAFT_12295 [Microdochium bolleyi]
MFFNFYSYVRLISRPPFVFGLLCMRLHCFEQLVVLLTISYSLVILFGQSYSESDTMTGLQRLSVSCCPDTSTPCLLYDDPTTATDALLVHSFPSQPCH